MKIGIGQIVLLVLVGGRLFGGVPRSRQRGRSDLRDRVTARRSRDTKDKADEEGSSTGRASGSKSEGCGFKSCSSWKQPGGKRRGRGEVG